MEEKPEAQYSDGFEAAASTANNSQEESCTFFYHPAEVQLAIARSIEIASSIDRAIAQFLKLSTPVPVNYRIRNGRCDSPINGSKFAQPTAAAAGGKITRAIRILRYLL